MLYSFFHWTIWNGIADPNVADKTNQTTIYTAGYNNNVTIMSLLLNVNKKYKNSFDWNKLINCKNAIGNTVFLVCCQNGNTESLKFLFKMEEENSKEYTTKIDVWVKRNRYHCTGLLRACDDNKTETIKFLVDKIYNNPDKKEIMSKFDINYRDDRGRTALWFAAYNGNLFILNLLFELFGKSIDLNICHSRGGSALHTASYHNHYRCVEWLLEQESCNVNLRDERKYSPLMVAIENGSVEAVKILCNCDRVTILNTKVSKNMPALDMSVFKGEIQIFQQLMITLLKRNNVENWDDLIKLNVINDEIIKQWFNYCNIQNNTGFLTFLTNVVNKAYNVKNFAMFRLLIDTMSENKGAGAGAEMYAESKRTCEYLFENCDKNTLIDLAKVINKGLSKYECKFSDSLLLLSKMVDNEAFVSSIEKVTQNCLVRKLDDVKPYEYFKHNLLNSVIWGEPAQASSVSKKEEKEKETEKEKEEQARQAPTLFHKMMDSVTDELRTGKELISDMIRREEKEHSIYWNQLKNSINNFSFNKNDDIRQNRVISRFLADNYKDLMANNKIKIEYKKSELPFDNVNGFNGINAYDYDAYLTKLIIASHQIDPIFQNEMKNMVERFGVRCSYRPAPPKTKLRCQTKAMLDYGKKEFPSCANILDFIRCSVVFENSADLVNGFNRFRSMIHNEYGNSNKKNKNDNKEAAEDEKSDNNNDNNDNNGDESNCIKYILRIKNGFNNESNRFKEIDGYRDIKFNVLIEYKGTRLIGEIQFLLKSMLKVKKMQHALYTFVRNEDYYEQLLSFDNKYYSKENEIYKIILSQNMSLFYVMLQNYNPKRNNNYLYKNGETIIKFLNENQWHKGLKLFKMFHQSWVKQCA